MLFLFNLLYQWLTELRIQCSNITQNLKKTNNTSFQFNFPAINIKTIQHCLQEHDKFVFLKISTVS